MNACHTLLISEYLLAFVPIEMPLTDAVEKQLPNVSMKHPAGFFTKDRAEAKAKYL